MGVFGLLAAMGATVFGWLRRGSKNHPPSTNSETANLSVVRSIVGPAAHEIGVAVSEQIKFWRLKNLMSISEKFDRICTEKNLNPSDLRPLAISVGLPMLEKASNEEDDELQELWANLMVSSTSNSDQGGESEDIYKTYTNVLAAMSKSDCRVLSAVVEYGVVGRREGAIISKPMSHDDAIEMARMSRFTAEIFLEKLVSLGLVYRDVRVPPKRWGHWHGPRLRSNPLGNKFVRRLWKHS